MQNKSLIYEENVELDKKLSLINNKIEENNKLIREYELRDINTYSRVDEIKYKDKMLEQSKLQNVDLKNPYFAKLLIKFKDENESIPVYIGKKRVDIDDEIIVYSWASPIASIYQKYDLGEYSEVVKNDRKVNNYKNDNLVLEGIILDKRKITIKDSKVIDVFQYRANSNNEDEYIKKQIETGDTEKLGVIVETVQMEQDKIIRLSIDKSVLVQGCAGSGKSSVAFHRLAYLAYNYDLRQEELLVISPNKIFQGYTDSILLELGAEYNPLQYTFYDFAKTILKININSDDKNIENNKYKTSKEFLELIDQYVNYLEEDYILKEDIIIDDFKLISYEEIKEIWSNNFGAYKINERIIKFKKYTLNYLKNKLREFLANIDSIVEKENQLLIKYINSPVQYNEILKLRKEEIKIKKKRLEKECTAIINGYINKYDLIDIRFTYKKLIDDRVQIGKLNMDNLDGKLNRIDYIPLMYLNLKINDIKQYRHIVIDECQDMSYIELAVLKEMTRSFTFVGDFNQKIKSNKNSITLEEVYDMFSNCTYFESYSLNKSFRNSMSITNYANKILEGYFVNEESIPIAFNRETAKPKVYQYMDKHKTLECIINNIKSRNYNENNIAIIFKDKEEAREYYNIFKYKVDEDKIHLIDNENCMYDKGISILPVELSKGLEFDYVMIINANRYEDNEEDRRLLYIAVTRALKELDIYIENQKCFVTSLDKKLWEKKYKVSNNDMDNGVKKLLIKQLSCDFGELPEKYVKAISSINTDELLFKIYRNIKTVESLEELDDMFVNEGILIKEEKINQLDEINEKEIEEPMEEIIYLDKYIKELKRKRLKLTDKQRVVLDYIIDNIVEVSNMKNSKDLANKLGISTSTISVTLLKINSSTFGNFISDIRECIRKDEKNNKLRLKKQYHKL